MDLQSTVIHGDDLAQQRIPREPLLPQPLGGKSNVEAETRPTDFGQQDRAVVVDLAVRIPLVFGADP
jgi:hypothetical protein